MKHVRMLRQVTVKGKLLKPGDEALIGDRDWQLLQSARMAVFIADVDAEPFVIKKRVEILSGVFIQGVPATKGDIMMVSDDDCKTLIKNGHAVLVRDPEITNRDPQITRRTGKQ